MPSRLRKVAQKILKDLGYPDNTEVSLSIVGDRTIRIINREYLNKDRPTNVISFALQEGDFCGINPSALGDVIISADTARREADEAGIPFFERLSFLMMHGILHICGYDHERCGEAEAEKMQKKEKELFNSIRKAGLLDIC